MCLMTLFLPQWSRREYFEWKPEKDIKYNTLTSSTMSSTVLNIIWVRFGCLVMKRYRFVSIIIRSDKLIRSDVHWINIYSGYSHFEHIDKLERDVKEPEREKWLTTTLYSILLIDSKIETDNMSTCKMKMKIINMYKRAATTNDRYDNGEKIQA